LRRPTTTRPRWPQQPQRGPKPADLGEPFLGRRPRGVRDGPRRATTTAATWRGIVPLPRARATACTGMSRLPWIRPRRFVTVRCGQVESRRVRRDAPSSRGRDDRVSPVVGSPVPTRSPSRVAADAASPQQARHRDRVARDQCRSRPSDAQRKCSDGIASKLVFAKEFGRRCAPYHRGARTPVRCDETRDAQHPRRRESEGECHHQGVRRSTTARTRRAQMLVGRAPDTARPGKAAVARESGRTA